MWQIIYKCAVSKFGCFPVGKLANKDPNKHLPESPLCTDHKQPMELQFFHRILRNKRPKEKKQPIPQPETRLF